MTNDAGSPIPGSCQRKSLDELLERDWSASPLGPVHSWPIELICTLRTIFEASSPYFLAWGPDLICFWNDAYARILAGRSAKMGQRFQEVWPEAWAIVGPIAHAALAGKSSYFEDLPLRLILDGEPQQTWWTFGYSPVPLATGEVGGVLATLVDQTKRVALEREIEEERQASYRFRDLMPDLLWEADGAGNVRYMNIAMRDYLGLDPAAASNWTDYIHPDDVPVIIKNLADAEERQGLFESQHRIRRKDGEYRWMLARSQPIVEGANGIVGWYGCASDIHDLLSAQDAVVQSRELLQQFADSTTQLMWVSSLDGREVEFANASARRFCRELAGRDDAVGWATCLSLLADGDTVLLGTAVERLRGGDIFQDNVQLAGPNGVRHLRITAFPIRESDGRILRFGCVAEMPKPLGLRRVYLVSRNAQLGRRLSSLLTDQGFEVRIFHDIRPLVQVAPALLPGCVVLSGVEDADWLRFSASAIRQLGSRLPTVALSEHHRDVDHVRTLMKAGIKDVLPAIGSAEQLTSAVASLIDEVNADLTLALDGGSTSRLGTLSGRERQILNLLAQGEANKTIARKLAISPRTVEAHRSRILERLGVRTLAEAVALAVTDSSAGNAVA